MRHWIIFSRKGEKMSKTLPVLPEWRGNISGTEHAEHCPSVVPLWGTDSLSPCWQGASQVTLFLWELLWPLWHAFPRLDLTHGPFPQPCLISSEPRQGEREQLGGMSMKSPRDCTDGPETLHEVTPRTWGHFPQAQGQSKWRETKCKLSASPLCRAADTGNEAKSFVCFFAFGNGTTDMFAKA